MEGDQEIIIRIIMDKPNQNIAGASSSGNESRSSSSYNVWLKESLTNS
jgi:hypothetical protein